MSRETPPAGHPERKSRDSAANRDAGALAFQMRLTSSRLTHGTNCLAAAELVRTKLEMGRTARLSFARAFRGWMRPPGILVATGIMKQSDAYKIALARAQSNPTVIEAIGSPISQTGIVSGNSNVSGAVGEAI
jgi:hypothetical protein